ncbi:Uncharacterised protein [uncultured archaeon]|nr:Uncharacterised protein [uncultured archaeon]
MVGIEARFAFDPATNDWKTPDIQTLSISTNMAAKKIRVCQSIRFATSSLFWLKSRMGSAEMRAMQVSGNRPPAPRRTVPILAKIRTTSMMKDISERRASSGSVISSLQIRISRLHNSPR